MKNRPWFLSQWVRKEEKSHWRNKTTDSPIWWLESTAPNDNFL